MTIRTIKTNEAEANRIIEDKVRFIFRSDKDCYNENDIIVFRVIKNNKEVLHKVNTNRYVVTTVTDCMNAPIVKGYQIVGFRKL